MRRYTVDMTSTVEQLDTETLDSQGGEQMFAHYAESVSVTEGYITGKPVLALCGKLFIPSRDPLKFPICPSCKEIVEALFLGEE